MAAEESLITPEIEALVGVEGPAREVRVTPELAERVEETVSGVVRAYVAGEQAPPYVHLAFETPAELPDTPAVPASLLTGDEWILHRPVRVGEQLAIRGRLASAHERLGSRFGHTLNVLSAWTIADASGRPVAEISRGMIRYRPPEDAVPAEPDDPPPPPHEPAHEGRSARELVEGDALPSAVIRPSLGQVVRYCGLTWNYLGFFFDPEAARRVGLPGPIVPGPFKMALIMHHLVAIAGPEGRIMSVRCAWRRPDRTGRPFTVHGLVTRVEETDLGRQVACELWTETTEGARSVSGSATLLVP